MAFLHHRKLYFANSSFEAFSDFPVFVNIDHTSGNFPDFDAYNNVSFHASDGARLSWGCKRFYTAGTSRYFVKVPSIAKSDTDYIYMYYGGDTSTEDKAGVCDTNTKLFTPMEDYGDTSHVQDWKGVSTLTKKGAAEPALTAGGSLGRYQTFAGDDDYIDTTYNGTDQANLTFEIYASVDAVPATANRYFFDNSNGNKGYGARQLNTGSDMQFFGYYTAAGVKVVAKAIPNTSANFYTARITPTKIDININGGKWSALSFAADTLVADGATTMNIGSEYSNASPLDGKMLLLRISHTARSDNWLKAQDKILRTQDYVTFGSQVDQIRAPHIRHKLVLIKGRL